MMRYLDTKVELLDFVSRPTGLDALATARELPIAECPDWDKREFRVNDRWRQYLKLRLHPRRSNTGRDAPVRTQ